MKLYILRNLGPDSNYSNLLSHPGPGWHYVFILSAASAAAITFASPVKTVWAKSEIFGTKNKCVWGNVLDDISMTLTQGSGCGIDYQNLLVFAIKLFWQFSFKKFGCVFSRSNTLGHIAGMFGPIDVKRKWSALVEYWVQYVSLTFDLTRDLDFGGFKVKFRNSYISGIVDLIDVKWKEGELIW